ncbi:uncharacterized protein N7487_010548 [Penicillium crustosum]|uniref:uncharacterized protein n=1 Tax=Penicillium crustosum TaxID=36656 RepID=UPI00239F604F|nr:uncharacterized protein N7487_010548 [Penicillium crustosum]KAJ5396245.1 hypothetical protein N7487_010548 [Penicillium crustosum]
MPSQCVDGIRKPPKYLNENTKKSRKASLCHGVTSPQQTQFQQQGIPNTTRYSNGIIEEEANDERHIKYYRSDSFEEVFDEVIDSNSFYTERSSFNFGNQPSEGAIVKGNDNFVTFFSDAAFATWSERSSSVSEDSELGTSYQAPEDGLGASLAESRRHARDEPYSGFAISSGWSSTFFPHEVEEEPNGC